ncbi:hypothetical protein WG66_009882 [Moniliophthora roreri]|nr:hypothetical protein WG66_009882 [Moniliophthora roreri]
MSSILFVFTSADKTLTGAQTGYYLPEAAHPYYVLAPHFKIDFASPKGANPPLDESSVKMFAKDNESVQWLNDETVKAKLASTKKLTEVNPDDYDVIFYPGDTHATMSMFTYRGHPPTCLQFYRAGKITAAVCHGPAALAAVTGADGKSIFAGRKATGFSNAEEEQVGKVKPKVLVDGNLYTGQNPNSARAIGEAILAALKK